MLTLSATQKQLFDDIFDRPSLQALQGLSATDFEYFVGYVFMRAGFDPTYVGLKVLRGVDLEIHEKPKRRFGGVETKRYAEDRLVQLKDVNRLLGARSLSNGRVRGYLVTTSDFTPKAYQAGNGRNICLINGASFIRYIQYIRHSTFEEIEAMEGNIPPDEFIRSVELVGLKTTATHVLTIANNKGGVGKSTTTRYLAQFLAQAGKKVLVIDLDAQSNLSEFLLGVPAENITKPDIGDYLSMRLPFSQIIRQTTFHPNLWLAPGNLTLTALDRGGLGRPRDEIRFVKDLYTSFAYLPVNTSTPFDWIILDTPPALSSFTRLALAAAQYVLAPARPRPSSVTGTLKMFRTLDAENALIGKPAHFIGGLITHMDDDATSRDTVALLEQRLVASRNSGLLDARIPYDITIEKVGGRRPTRAEIAYEAATQEVIEYVNSHPW